MILLSIKSRTGSPSSPTRGRSAGWLGFDEESDHQMRPEEGKERRVPRACGAFVFLASSPHPRPGAVPPNNNWEANMDSDQRRRSTRRAPRRPSPRRGRGGESMTPFEEVRNVERLVGQHGLRSLPWHWIFRQQLQDGTASPAIVKAGERSRREWERANVPMIAPAPEQAPGPASRSSLHQARSPRRLS
jgi:hypothetical protein